MFESIQGYEEGNNVTPFYDPMISKCIVSGTDRQDVLHKAKLFFEDVTIDGVKTNIPPIQGHPRRFRL